MTMEEAKAWFEWRARSITMPGARSAYLAAIEALTQLTQEQMERIRTGGEYSKPDGDLRLEKCPFCGSVEVVYEKYLHAAGYRWRVMCMGCMASIDPGYAQQRSTVQRMWNTRAPVLAAEQIQE